MANEHLTVDPDEDNVPLMKSPVVRVKSFPKESPSPADDQGGNPNLEILGWRESDDDHPEFEKHAEATNIEVFYDLFFAAILCVFAEVQDVTNLQQLNSFIAYFVLLWLGSWALLGLFDVRFITDSIFGKSSLLSGWALLIESMTNRQVHRTIHTSGAFWCHGWLRSCCTNVVPIRK